MEDRALLEGADLYGNVRSRFGGLVVVGSHVQKTTRRMEVLRKREGLCFLEFSVEGIGDEEKMEGGKEAGSEGSRRADGGGCECGDLYRKAAADGGEREKRG